MSPSCSRCSRLPLGQREHPRQPWSHPSLDPLRAPPGEQPVLISYFAFLAAFKARLQFSPPRSSPWGGLPAATPRPVLSGLAEPTQSRALLGVPRSWGFPNFGVLGVPRGQRSPCDLAAARALPAAEFGEGRSCTHVIRTWSGEAEFLLSPDIRAEAPVPRGGRTRARSHPAPLVPATSPGRGQAVPGAAPVGI